MREASVLSTQSYSSRSSTDKQYPLFPLVNCDDIRYFGKLFFELLSIEYSAFVWNNLSNVCVWCILREQGSPLALPCGHVISNEMSIRCSDVHPRYLRIDTIIKSNSKRLGQKKIFFQIISIKSEKQNLILFKKIINFL